MQTNISKNILSAELTNEADKILRSCVHCGFCTATCPTYQIFADELDGPRGRIYLIKQMLEGQAVTKKTLTHLDRCLTCRSCETTCPSGVQYSRLLDIGKQVAEKKIKRSSFEKLSRKALLSLLLSKNLFSSLISIAQPVTPFLTKKYQTKIKVTKSTLDWPATKHPRQVILLTGCAQNTFAPNIDKQLAQLLDKCGIQTIPLAGCCGALPQHMSAEAMALQTMQQNIDQWMPYIKDANYNIEAIIMSSSGCGVTLKEYKKYLQYDSVYKKQAEIISGLAKDPVELLEKNPEQLEQSSSSVMGSTLSFHAPCTLQHGLGVHHKVEYLLKSLGYRLNIIKDAHLCCGSAGSYSVFHPKISGELLRNKIAALEEKNPERIATSNIGCLMHLNTQAKTQVKHWLSVVYENLK